MIKYKKIFSAILAVIMFLSCMYPLAFASDSETAFQNCPSGGKHDMKEYGQVRKVYIIGESTHDYEEHVTLRCSKCGTTRDSVKTAVANIKHSYYPKVMKDYHKGSSHYYLYVDTCVCGKRTSNQVWKSTPCSGPPCVVPYSVTTTMQAPSTTMQIQNIAEKVETEHLLSTVSAQINPNSDISATSIVTTQELKSFSEESIALLIKLNPVGYAIIDPENKIVLEASTEFNHPFYVDDNKQYYYDGVFQYYEKAGGVFINLATGELKAANACKISSPADFYHYPITKNVTTSDDSIVSTVQATSGEKKIYGSTRLYNCNVSKNYSYYFPDFTQSQLDKVKGVCGSVACAIVMAYYDDYRSGLGDFAEDKKKTSGSVANNTYGRELTKELVKWVEPKGNGSIFLNPGLLSYLNTRGISVGSVCAMHILNLYNAHKECIDKGRPTFVGLTDHYCVGIGYRNNGGTNQIFVNSGYGYTAWINASSLLSLSTMKF